MPQLGSITPACWMAAMPQIPEDRYQLLTDDGWADQSALFYPERYLPTEIPMLITAGNLTELASRLAAIRALRKTKVKVDDGLYPKDKCLVLGVKAGVPARCGMIIGGTGASDTWEQEVAVMLLAPSPAVA